MRLVMICIAVVLAAAPIDRICADEKQAGAFAQRKSLYHMNLLDGTVLAIYAHLRSTAKQEPVEIEAFLFPKAPPEGEKQEWIWKSKRIASVNSDANEKDPYYALVKVTTGQIFVFCTWNAQHCVLDKVTGRILDHGEGDDVLVGYDCLEPLKLSIVRPSIVVRFTKEELRQFEEEEDELDKEEELFLQRERLKEKGRK